MHFFLMLIGRTLVTLLVCPMCYVSICCVCVHWGWGMWVGKILKIESAFVRAVLRLIAKADEATLLTSHKAFFPRVVHTSHLSNQQVNHCGAGVRQSTERPLQTAVSPHHPHIHIPKKKSSSVFTHCQLCPVCLFHLLMFHLPEELGYLLYYLLRCSHPERRSHEDVLTQSLG